MHASSRVARVTSSLSFRLFLILFLAILSVFLIYAAMTGRSQRRMLEEQVKADAYRASDFIRRSLLTHMQRNERDAMYAMITLLGTEPGVRVIRIYNKLGEIKFSSDEVEIGRAVDLEAEACYACHATSQPLEALPSEERARIYHAPDAHRVLAVINAIPNLPECWNASCHAHGADQSVLGVLDVQMSMDAADAALAQARRRAVTIGVAVILLSLLLTAGIVYRWLHVPTRRLRRATEALTAGNLDTAIAVERSDELGALAASFNRMARSLQRADQELRAWSQTLEDRVQAKSDELERIAQHMIQVEKTISLGKMAATVAHELNNPLSGIVTYAKLAAKRIGNAMPDGPRKIQLLDHLELIRAESLRCGHIVRDLLMYARRESATFEPNHVHDLVARALRLIDHHAAFAHVRIHTLLRLDNDLVVCDGDQIEQALVALLINAGEAMPDGGDLSVETADVEPERGAGVALTVADSGVGIPEEARDHIFDPFFSTKSEAKGVGLGLSVAYGIVRRHEGTIAVTSRPGDGAAFTIELPRDPAAPLRAVPVEGAGVLSR